MSEKFEQEAIEAYQYDRQNNINESGVLMLSGQYDWSENA